MSSIMKSNRVYSENMESKILRFKSIMFFKHTHLLEIHRVISSHKGQTKTKSKILANQ